MYKFAYKHNDEVIFYFDACGNKYVACGGNLAWRINNPGLVRSHCHFAGVNGSIGSCSGYAIFANPQQGHQALSDWLHSKKYYNSSLKTVAEHYQPNDPDGFLNKLVSYAQLSADRKIKSLTQQEFNHFLKAIEKCCGYIALGNEKLSLLPKIIAKIDNGNSQEETYLIGSNRILTKAEAIDWITSHQLDGVIVYDRNGRVHLRSRPSHCIWDIRIHEAMLPPSEGQIDTLMRCVGEQRKGQCIWAFINGVSNTKDSALESANLISKAAQGERVFSMPNDSAMLGIKDLFVCGVLKLTADTPKISKVNDGF
jgi:hypothetical protein